MKHHGCIVSVAVAALIFMTSGPAYCGERDTLRDELRTLVDQEGETFLLTEIQRIQPFYAIRHLARFQDMQDRVGGGFCGCPPYQLMKADEIPLPVDDIGVLQAAVFLATERKLNYESLEALGFPVVFPSTPLPDISSTEQHPNATLHIDLSVPTTFLDALNDGEVTIEEARAIAKMPANQEMLQSVCAKHEGAGPWVTEKTLAFLIWKAGSSDPLDLLWRWVNPLNDFGYGDLATNAAQYRRLIEDLQMHQQDVADAALARVAPFFPPDAVIDENFVLTPACFTADWTTPSTSGANVAYIKDGWEDMVRRISAGVFRRQLLHHLDGRDGAGPQTIDDLICVGLGDERLDGLHELIAYTVFEGTVDYVSNPSSPVDHTSRVVEGATIVHDYVAEVVNQSQLEYAHTIFERGRGPDGSLKALGRHMAQVITQRDGAQAMTALLRQGCVPFFERSLEIELDQGGTLFDEELMIAVRDLAAHCPR